MYYDQGLVVFKVLVFEDGVNFMVGLLIVCILFDYGIVFDIVGQNKVYVQFFRSVVYLVMDIYCNCVLQKEMMVNLFKL